MSCESEWRIQALEERVENLESARSAPNANRDELRTLAIARAEGARGERDGIVAMLREEAQAWRALPALNRETAMQIVSRSDALLALALRIEKRS